MTLRRKLDRGDRITPEEALALFSWDLIDLGKAADMRRKRVHPGEEVGFIIDRIINYSNLCEAACGFCAFHAGAEHAHPYELTTEEIVGKVKELAEAGGTQVMLQGGLHPDYTLDTYVRMVRAVKDHFPGIYLHSFSPAEIVHIARKDNLSIDDVVKALKEAGVDSVPGASDLLVDRIRKKVSPNKISVREWRRVMETLCHHELKSSATMTYGMGETLEEKIEHLTVVRDIQDRTGNLRAFIPWSFSPANTSFEGFPRATGIDFLKIVAVSRIFLDNMIFIQSGWLTEGLRLAQIALAMGANDMGGVLTEEVVVRAAGIDTRTDKAEMIRIIKDAGKIPVQRDSEYRVMEKPVSIN